MTSDDDARPGGGGSGAAGPEWKANGVRRRVTTRHLLAAALALAGLACLGQSIWISAKAQLAQLLLDRAWSLVVAGESRAKPWPWADTWPVARLELPRENERLVVLAGASGRTMAFGPGHVDGTAEPGSAGNCVITAHRDTHFEPLQHLARGEAIDLETRDGKTRRYLVDDTFVTDESDTVVLKDDGSERLTLVTCWPFDAVVPGGPLRYVVVAVPE
ncbi:MAG: class GN sortase [Thermoanaerobaculia bacterium]